MAIDGFCDPKFSALREAFAENFASRGEPGAAVALSVNGKLVADLWGGWRDAARTQAWRRETLVNFFSVSKALCTIVAMRLVEHGKLDLDAPVARVCSAEIPIPYPKHLEEAAIPQVPGIIAAARAALGR